MAFSRAIKHDDNDTLSEEEFNSSVKSRTFFGVSVILTLIFSILMGLLIIKKDSIRFPKITKRKSKVKKKIKHDGSSLKIDYFKKLKNMRIVNYHEKRLKDFFDNAKKQGWSEKKIRKKLLDKHWPKDMVSKLFK